MAIVKFGAIVTGIKGKVGGQVFQGGRSATIFKNKGNSIGASSGRQTAYIGDDKSLSRTNFAIVTKHWASLTDGERTSWSALIGVWTFFDKFGDVYEGTAYQIFTAVNLNRLSLELALLDTAPIKVDASDEVYSITNYSLTTGWNLTRLNQPVPAQNQYIQLSFPQNPTRNLGSIGFFKGATTSFGGLGPLDLSSAYEALIGYEPPLGSFVYLKLWTCNPAYPRQQFKITLRSEVVA